MYCSTILITIVMTTANRNYDCHTIYYDNICENVIHIKLVSTDTTTTFYAYK